MGNDLFVAMLMTAVVCLVGAKMFFVVTSWQSVGARFWPWLRMRPWWPVSSERRAETLLYESLTPPEYSQLVYTGYLEIPSPTKLMRVYRIPRGPGQVLVVEGNRVIERLCVQPAASGLPEADVVLMHKLLIEADEETYLKTANHFPRSVWRY